MFRKIFIITVILGAIFYFSQDRTKVSIAAIFYNESPWLKEWIEYHRLVGIDHFLLYNNESDDDWENVLDPYIKEGIVEVIAWPSKSHNGDFHGWVYATQTPAMTHAIKSLQGKTDWVFLIDTDEFIVPKQGGLKKFLNQYYKEGGLAINWMSYGTSGIEKLGSGELLIEKLTRRSTPHDPINTYIKSCVRPDAVNKVSNPHFPKMKEGFKLVFSDHEPYSPESKKIIHNSIQLNHYSSRTLQYAREEKIPKKERMTGQKISEELKDVILNGLNTEEDTEKFIYKYIPHLKRGMAK